MSNSPAEPRYIAVALHDVSPATWPQCQRLLELIAAVGPSVPVSLLVVPDYHARGAIERQPEWRSLIDARLARGDEVLLHGWRHLDDSPDPRTPLAWLARRVFTHREAEFAALPVRLAAQRIEKGLHVFRRCGWRPRGFVAPAWQLGPGARLVLTDYPFDYTSTLRHLYQLPDWTALAAWNIGASVRTPWRRWLSRRWMSMLEAATADDPIIRLGLHPADADHEPVVQALRAVLERLLATRRPVTKGALIDTLGPRPSQGLATRILPAP